MLSSLTFEMGIIVSLFSTLWWCHEMRVKYLNINQCREVIFIICGSANHHNCSLIVKMILQEPAIVIVLVRQAFLRLFVIWGYLLEKSLLCWVNAYCGYLFRASNQPCEVGPILVILYNKKLRLRERDTFEGWYLEIPVAVVDFRHWQAHLALSV